MPYTPTTWTNGSGQPINAANLTKIERQVQLLTDGAFYLDSYSCTDDQKLTAAMADQQASAGSTNMPPILLPARPLTFNTPRTMYSGLKIQGMYSSGQKNPEQSAGNFVMSEVKLTSGITNGVNSWWNGNGGSLFDVYMADFTVEGSGQPGYSQFMDVPSGTLYACEFHALSFNFMMGVFGNTSRKCLMTQVALTGSWTMNNAWGCQMNVGGSDCIFFMDSFNNVGTGSAAVLAGGINSYYFRFDNIEAQLGKVYISTVNGYRGMLYSGNAGGVDMHGGVYEGFKPTRVDGLFSGPGPGTNIRQTGGMLSMHGVKIGQAMDNPDATEHGMFEMTGGECSMFGVQFYGVNCGTVPSVYHSGGKLAVYGATKRQDQGWTGRPILASTAPAPTQDNKTASYTLVHDDSMSLSPDPGNRETDSFTKTSGLVANDFAGKCVVGDLALDTTNRVVYMCTATNGSTTSSWLHTTPLRKAGALVANDFAGVAVVGSDAIDTTTGTRYTCSATNGTTTATWMNVTPLRKVGALVPNDFATVAYVGSQAVDTTTGVLYVCTAANGSTTSTWVVVGAQT